MSEKLLIVDCDGTVSRISNPFFAVARKLSCYEVIQRYTHEYLAGRITYQRLVSLENPAFQAAARKYAQDRGHAKFGPDLFSDLLGDLMGDRLVHLSTVRFLKDVRSWGYEIGMISSGWEAIVSRAASEAAISYWRANKVLFIDGEFAGTDLRVPADKIEEFEAAVRTFRVDYRNVRYLGDNEFDLIGMKFIHEHGGTCLVYEPSAVEQHVSFPAYVKRFTSRTDMEDYFRAS